MAKKFKKRKVIHCNASENFSVTTTVYGGKKSRTIKGEPKIVFHSNGSVQIGCIQISKRALATVFKHATGKFRFHQVGNYEV